MALRQQQVLHSGIPNREQRIFTDPDGHVPHPDTFTRHLRKLYKQCGLSEDATKIILNPNNTKTKSALQKYIAMRFLSATGRIRTSGLPGRRTTAGRCKQTLKREFCCSCTFTAKTRKSPLLVVTTGFLGILRGDCTVVVKWWSTANGQKFGESKK